MPLLRCSASILHTLLLPSYAAVVALECFYIKLQKDGKYTVY